MKSIPNNTEQTVAEEPLKMIFNYGDVRIDIVGRWDVDTHAIKNPQGLKNYVESLMQAQDVSKLQQFIVN